MCATLLLQSSPAGWCKGRGITFIDKFSRGSISDPILNCLIGILQDGRCITSLVFCRRCPSGWKSI